MQHKLNPVAGHLFERVADVVRSADKRTGAQPAIREAKDQHKQDHQPVDLDQAVLVLAEDDCRQRESEQAHGGHPSLLERLGNVSARRVHQSEQPDHDRGLQIHVDPLLFHRFVLSLHQKTWEHHER